MPEKPPPIGTLYISREVLQYEKWMVDQAIQASMIIINKYKPFDGFLKPAPIRRGDFSLIIADVKFTPFVAVFIGIPGMQKAAIVEEMFVAG